MKNQKLSLLFILLLLGNIVFAQYPEGTIIEDSLYSALLENPGGENPTRRLRVYLPNGYEEGTRRYPVIYLLHGFTSSDKLLVNWKEVLDEGIATHKIKPLIVVCPNQHTLYRGSWYTNSSYTGKWADFTGIDLVNYIDKKYRTIPKRDSRGIAGHSMGGQGAIKMGMFFPDVFSSVYALSPATLGIAKELGIKDSSYRQLSQIQTREELIEGFRYFYPNVYIAMGRAYTPNLNNPPFYADIPFTYQNDSLVVNYEVLKIWNEKSVLGMVDVYADNLRKLKAIKIDWGRNENNLHIPITCRMLSQRLENMGVKHYAEEYIGDHWRQVATKDGRVLYDLLPFFDLYLTFE